MLLAASVLWLSRALSTGPTLPPNPLAAVVSPTAIAPAASQTKPDPRPRPGELTVEIGEADLSGRLNRELAGRPLGQTSLGAATVERVQVSLRNGRAEGNGTARLAGNSVPFSSRVTAAPTSTGRVQLEMTDLAVAGVPAPEAIRSDMEAEVQRVLDDLLARQPMRIRTVEISEGRLRAVGTPGR